ncbi:MAG: chemotaxis-specific protein-glutamate methyltransferase CheB [Telmatospirillum sp.]|nr:chemotaxis-specific protein-glutamate methyltransferase CheB [Telmatospirillum sp.]
MRKVLVADDSALMRRHFRDLLEGEGGYEVLAVRNGAEALAALESFKPDVITLDVNMPVMDGLTCLARIMAVGPRPVIMVSSLTAVGAEVTLEALALGAVDFIQKPGGTISLSIDRIEREILAKIEAAARARVRRATGLRDRLRLGQGGIPSRSVPPVAGRDDPLPGVVVVGVSTGGPGTLEGILTALPSDFPWAVVIAQHMPGAFTPVFAKRLNDICALPVAEAARQTVLLPGTVHIAKGDADLVFSRRGEAWVVNPMPPDPSRLWHPSVSRLVDSALRTLPADRIIGVMLTGMGEDGAAEMTELRRRGGRTIAQDEASSVVWGMPGELVRRGGADVVLPSERIVAQLESWLRMRGRERSSWSS